jgi:hypothetical protein
VHAEVANSAVVSRKPTFVKIDGSELAQVQDPQDDGHRAASVLEQRSEPRTWSGGPMQHEGCFRIDHHGGIDLRDTTHNGRPGDLTPIDIPLRLLMPPT